MTFVVKSPADVERMKEEIIQKEIDYVEQCARVAVDYILKEAALVGTKRIYLYNEGMGYDLERWPKDIVRRAVEMLNGSGLWRARAIRVHTWHALFLFNINHRLRNGSPVWRIFLSPAQTH